MPFLKDNSLERAIREGASSDKFLAERTRQIISGEKVKRGKNDVFLVGEHLIKSKKGHVAKLNEEARNTAIVGGVLVAAAIVYSLFSKNPVKP